MRDGAIVKLRRHNVEVLRRQRDSTQLEFQGRLADAHRRGPIPKRGWRSAQSDLTTAEGQLATSRADFMQVIGRPAETLESKPALPKLPNTDDAVLPPGR